MYLALSLSLSLSLSRPLFLALSPRRRAPVRPPHPQQFRGAGGEEQGEAAMTMENNSSTFVVNGIELDREETRQARVLYDYEAVNESEITVYCDEVG